MFFALYIRCIPVLMAFAFPRTYRKYRQTYRSDALVEGHRAAPSSTADRGLISFVPMLKKMKMCMQGTQQRNKKKKKKLRRRRPLAMCRCDIRNRTGHAKPSHAIDPLRPDQVLFTL